MKRSLLLIGVAIAAVAAALVWTFVVSRGHDREIAIATHDGARTAIILPAGHGPKRTVIVLHGAMMTAEMTAHDTGFDEAAAKHGFTAIFPRGLNRRWHDQRADGWNGPDDVAFLKALIARLVAEHIALPNQIYIAGISSGGEMSFTMACLAGDLIRGLGAIVATMPEGLKPCTPPAMPVVMFDGTADPLVPYTGGKVSWLAGGGELWSVEQTAEYFARRNGCGPSSTRDLPSLTRSDETSVTDDRLERMCVEGAGAALSRQWRRPSDSREIGRADLLAWPRKSRHFSRRNNYLRVRTRGCGAVTPVESRQRDQRRKLFRITIDTSMLTFADLRLRGLFNPW